MASDADVINGNEAAQSPGQQPTAPAPQAEPTAAPVPTTPRQSWTMPKSPITREHVDTVGRAATKAVIGVAKAIAAVARYGGGVVRQIWRAIDQVPPALQALSLCGVLMLLGVVGSIALSGTAGLLCAIVVVPVCSIAVGALGHRWFGRHDAEQADDRGHAAAETSELERSVAYVDKKLTLALNSFGSERHQQAVIALFQAKTAVELALGTEQDTASHIDEPVSVDDYGLRPRIQAGPASRSTLPESNSLAAS